MPVKLKFKFPTATLTQEADYILDASEEHAAQILVRGVGGALGVVPGHRLWDHSDHLLAKPRRASRSRRSSSAV